MTQRIPSLGNDGTLPAMFAGYSQQIDALAALAAGAANNGTQITHDQYLNATFIMGQLNQIVTIGAGWPDGTANGGVLVATGLPGFGAAAVSAFAGPTTIDLTAGTNTATVASAAGLTVGMQCGAATDPDPLYGVQVPAISPGTTIDTIDGTAVTLSQPALLDGTGLFFCACTWTQQNINANS